MDEISLVQRLVAIGWKGSRAVLLGPGDDAAILRGGLALSTDLMVEDVHFRFDWITPVEVGFRAGAAALSDMAAMGAAPEALLVSLAASGDPSLCEGLQRGIRRAGDRVAVAVVGGDVSRSPGPVVVDVVAVGRARKPLLRGAAAAGQEVWVSGELGGAAAAVAAWSAGDRPAATARNRFVTPPNRVPLGVALASRGLARAAIDVSDGLVADARHIARASGVALRIHGNLVPVDPCATLDGANTPDAAVAPGAPTDPGFANGATERALNLALQGGDDYELMFTAPAGHEAGLLELGREMSVRLTRIGTVERGEGVILEDGDGRRIQTGTDGYDHFAAPGTTGSP